MTNKARLVLVAVSVLMLDGVWGCGGSNGANNQQGNAGTVTGEIFAAVGGAFVALGGQTVAIGTSTATSQAGTGRFTITGVAPGAFAVVVTPQPGFGTVLNPAILAGNVAAGQTVDIGRVLLGQRPPDPTL